MDINKRKILKSVMVGRKARETGYPGISGSLPAKMAERIFIYPGTARDRYSMKELTTDNIITYTITLLSSLYPIH